MADFYILSSPLVWERERTGLFYFLVRKDVVVSFSYNNCTDQHHQGHRRSFIQREMGIELLRVQSLVVMNDNKQNSPAPRFCIV